MATSGELLRRHGYAGTGLKQIAEGARAPFGSIYHFFPGGKQELATEVVRAEGRAYREFVVAILDQADSAEQAMELGFTQAAARLVESDFADACPIATLALEVASTNEPLREATAEVFTDWIDAGTSRFERWGYPAEAARQLTIAFLNALEGAFVLARALRSTEPLEVAQATMRAAVAAARQAPLTRSR